MFSVYVYVYYKVKVGKRITNNYHSVLDNIAYNFDTYLRENDI